MDHKFINEFDLFERYLMGGLAPEESAKFEAHFVDCLECIGRLNTTKALMDGLRIVARDRALEPPGYKPRGLSWPLQRLSSKGSLALAAGILLLVASIAAVAVYQIRGLRIEEAQARIASAEWERRYEEERESSSLAEMRHQDSERELTTEVARLRAELGDENKQTAEDKSDDRGALSKPQINFVTIVLKATRGNEPATGAPNEIVVPRSPANFAIWVQLEGEGEHKAYRVTIRGDHDRLIWKESGLKPNRSNSLSVAFSSTFFRDGDYLLTVEAVAGDGRTSVVGEYPFRVVKNSMR